MNPNEDLAQAIAIEASAQLTAFLAFTGLLGGGSALPSNIDKTVHSLVKAAALKVIQKHGS